MKLNTAKNLQTAQKLISHLSTWGEIAVCELSSLSGCGEWLDLLKQAGVVEECSAEGKPVAWSLARNARGMLDAEPQTALRMALYQIPDYRRYIVSILAEGLALAAKADMREQLETWTGSVLLPLLDEINRVLDVIEAEGRLIDETTNTISRRCAQLTERGRDWSDWDQFLMGRSGRPQDLFDFALNRFAPLAVLPENPDVDRVPACLRSLPLNSDEGFDLSQPPSLAPWNIRRQRVWCGVALFDEHGQVLGNVETKAALRQTLQDALIEQPFYKAVVHLAIIAWRSPATTAPSLELYLPPDAPLADVSVLFDGREVGKLTDLLPDLVGVQGFRVCGLDGDQIAPELMENLLHNLLTLEVLCQTDDSLALHPDFQSSLMATRLRTVFRPGKVLQERMVGWLANRNMKTGMD